MRSTGPCSITRPRYMTITWSAIWAITPRSCVMKMIAVPRDAWSLRSRRNTWAWVVTSTAVVGSSAIRRRGLQDNAMAIRARWRRPPLSCQAYWSRCCSGAGMPTSPHNWTARRLASRSPTSRCSAIASRIWLPTECTGLNAAIGSCGISAISPPRMRGIAQPVADEVEREHGDDHGHAGEEQPGRLRDGLDVLGLLQQHPPTDRRRADPEAQEAERRFADNQHRDGEGTGGDDVARQRRHHVPPDDAEPAAAGEFGGEDEVLLPQREEPAAHFPAERGPADQGQDQGDREEHLLGRPVPRQRGAHRQPDRDRGQGRQRFDHP